MIGNSALGASNSQCVYDGQDAFGSIGCLGGPGSNLWRRYFGVTADKWFIQR